MHEDYADDDNASTDLNGGVINASSDCALEREAFDDFVTRGIPYAFGGYNSDDSFIAGNENEVEEFFIYLLQMLVIFDLKLNKKMILHKQGS